jgi:hypothetical protein
MMDALLNDPYASLAGSEASDASENKRFLNEFERGVA